jgi:hypothetical protein
MKYTALGICFLISALWVKAQNSKSYTIQAGGTILEVVPKNEMYEYAEFQPGMVTFKTGVNSQARMNYNYIYEAIQFISSKGDTLVISKPEDVKAVTIGNAAYYYVGERYVKLDTVIGKAQIGIAGFFAIINKKKIGGYGLRTEGGADSYGSFAVPGSNQANYNFSPNVETIVSYRRALYIGDQSNHFVPVTRKNILSFYSGDEKKLKAYLDNEKPSFTSREDLIRLLEYMEGK